MKKYDARFPYANMRLQVSCSQGGPARTPLPATRCPGNRRWIQLVFDAFLLQQSETSMLDARDAMLAADRMRFGGANQKVMWGAFARRGMGKGAKTPDADSQFVTPSFASPKAKNARVTFKSNSVGRVYVGRYEARATPVGDTRRGTKLDNVVELTAGTYDLLFVSERSGHTRFELTVKPGQRRTVRIRDIRNVASAKLGANVLRSTPGSRDDKALLDGKENTNWAGVTAATVDRSKPSVAIDLAGGTHTIRRVQVSALLNPPEAKGENNPDSGSRFTALRRFAVEACLKACNSGSAKWKRFYTSPKNAFPSIAPRPTSPTLSLRSFRVPATRALALRFVVLENQCTGNPDFGGEQDNDPLNDTDCATASTRGTIVNTAEFQAFER